MPGSPSSFEPRSVWQVGVGIAALAYPYSDSPWVQLSLHATGAALILLAVLGSTVSVISSTLFTFGVFTIPPTSVGEQGTRLTIPLLAGFVVLVGLIYRRRDRLVTIMPALPLVLMAAYWLFVHLSDSTAVASLPTLVVFLIALVVAAASASNIDRATDALRLFAASIAVMAVTWWIALVTGAAMTPVAYVGPETEGWRPEFFYQEALAGWVLTSSRGFLGTTRSTMIAAEPGTWATLCVVAAAAAAMAFRGRTRWLMIGALGLGVVASQSYGALILVMVAGLAFVFARAVHRGRLHPLGAAAGLAGAIAAWPLASFLIRTKEATNASSLTDRGLDLASLTFARSNFTGRINLLSSFGVDGLAALIPVVAMLAMIVWAPHPALKAAGIFVLLDALLLQPVTFHVGVFLVLAVASVAATRPSGTGDVGVGSLDQEPDRAHEGRQQDAPEVVGPAGHRSVRGQ